MVYCRMLQGPLAGNIVSIDAADAAQGVADGWAEPVATFDEYPWPYNVDRAELATPPPASFDEWEENGSPPGAPQGPPQPLDPPTLSSISPTSKVLGDPAVTLTLTGTKFTPACRAFVQASGYPDSELVTTFVSTTSLTAVIGTDAPAAGDVGIVVKQGENTTAPQTFTFEAAAPSGSAPTDITLTPNTIASTAAIGDPVGTLTATDPDSGDTFSYSLVSDGGGLFALAGDTINSASDALPAGDQTIRVRVVDSQSLAFEKDLTITVTAPAARRETK